MKYFIFRFFDYEINEELFGRNFLREFFSRIFWEDFLGRIFWEDILAGFFGRIFLGGILWEEYKNYFNIEGIDCLSRFWFFSRYCLNGEGRKNFESLEVRAQAHRK